MGRDLGHPGGATSGSWPDLGHFHLRSTLLEPHLGASQAMFLAEAAVEKGPRPAVPPKKDISVFGKLGTLHYTGWLIVNRGPLFNMCVSIPLSLGSIIPYIP